MKIVTMNKLIQLLLLIGCFCAETGVTVVSVESAGDMMSSRSQPKVGIVGGGAAGITAAYLLSKFRRRTCNTKIESVN